MVYLWTENVQPVSDPTGRCELTAYEYVGCEIDLQAPQCPPRPQVLHVKKLLGMGYK